MPGPRSAEDRVQARRIAKTPVELDVIYTSAAPAVDVDELIVEHPVDKIHPLRFHQTDPPLVMSIKGIAANETPRMITK